MHYWVLLATQCGPFPEIHISGNTPPPPPPGVESVARNPAQKVSPGIPQEIPRNAGPSKTRSGSRQTFGDSWERPRVLGACIDLKRYKYRPLGSAPWAPPLGLRPWGSNLGGSHFWGLATFAGSAPFCEAPRPLRGTPAAPAWDTGGPCVGHRRPQVGISEAHM